jgi:hypothetical protein
MDQGKNKLWHRTQDLNGGAACVREQVDGAIESGLIASFHLLGGEFGQAEI